MAKIYAQANGALLGFASTYSQQTEFAVHLPSAANVLEFDETTNASLITDLKANWSHYTLPSVNYVITLEKDGQPVTVAAMSGLYSARKNIIGGVSLSTVETYMQLLWGGTATNSQAQQASAYLLLKTLDF